MNIQNLFSHRDPFASQLVRQKARQLVRHPAFNRSELRDIEQELVLELVRKYRCYDPERAQESTFIARIVESKIASMIRIRMAEKRDFRRDAHSLNETIRDSDGGCVERSQTLDASAVSNHTGQSKRSDRDVAELRRDVADILQSLSNDERELAELLMEQTEYAASRILGRSRRQIAKEVARLRELFEDVGMRGYL